MSDAGFQPPWQDVPAPEGTWRSILKWGDAAVFKHPNAGLYALMKQTFGLGDEAFARPRNLALEPVGELPPSRLNAEARTAFEALLGPDNVVTDGLARLRAAHGKTMLDLMLLREGLAEQLPDAVLHPRHARDVEAILALCKDYQLPVVALGGGTSVTRGLACPKGGVTLDLRTHMRKVLAFNETDQTITVQAGLYGPALEGILHAAPRLFAARHAYTCGHFPQSFEYTTVGGWVVTRGAGQNSTYYGRIEDLVVAQEMVTPAGVLRTSGHPAAATGPDLDEVLMGSEGAFGILTAVTLKVFRHQPEHRRRFSYLLPSWTDAQDAVREVLQQEEGRPSVFRLSDPEETDVVLKLYRADRPWLNALSKAFGLRAGERCLLLGTTDGGAATARATRRALGRVVRAHGGVPTTGLVTRAWEHGRFTDPYLREDLQDVGVLIDTLECSVTWDALDAVHRAVRAVVKARPQTICMTHLSHAYPQGGNLYFIFITRMEDRAEYLRFHGDILDAIQRSGAAMSHHHGIGKLLAPWLEGQLGRPTLDVFRALKRHFDPDNLMNPGGTLALDLPDDQRRLPVE